MRQLRSLTILLLLALVVPLAAFAADSFKVTVTPANLELGKTGTLQFVLDNPDKEYYGFQAELTLPNGLVPLKGDDGQFIILSNRFPADGEYQVNSNYIESDNTLIVGTFSGKHKPITGTYGVLAEIKVNVTNDFKGGSVLVDNIYFIDVDNKDVGFDATSIKPGVAVTEIKLSQNEAELKVGETVTLTGTVSPISATDKTLKWSTSDATVATVDATGKVTAKGLGKAIITATCKCGDVSASCEVNVIPTPVAGLSVLDAAENPLTEGASIAIHTGEEYNFTAVVTLEGGIGLTDKKVSWTTNDPSVIEFLDNEGLIKALKAGEATVTATIADYSVTVNVNVTDETVAVTSITLDQTKAAINTNQTLKLKATVLPAEAAATRTVTWSSSDRAIATVSTTGLVTAKKKGSVIITAKAGDKTATCEITITDIDVTGVELNKTEVTLTEGETVNLTATVTPNDATDQTVTWTSSDEDVATVTDEGVVIAVAPGNAVITATAGNVSATCTITVEAPFVAVETITLDKTTGSIEEGKTLQLKATVKPTDATDRTVNWTSSDPAVATVDAKGLVTAVKAGTATITAKAGEKSATCTVTVTAKTIAVTGITLDKTEATIIEGKTLTLTATVAPENATDKTVTWSSSNEAVATVDNGKVTALTVGKATITAKAGDKTATCTITVEANLIGSSAGSVKMTYVNMDEPDKAYGEIATGETAQSGYNKISGGSVGFGNTGWGENYITYLQVNVSEIEGTIIGATLSFEGSGSTDNKRETSWGVGYNSSAWSADMTYNTADKTITTMGEVKKGTSKSAKTFNEYSFDISAAVKHADEKGFVTILVYETAAAGGFIKNPTVSINWTKEATYDVTFTETSGAEGVKVIVDDLDVTNGTKLLNGTYEFTATAPHYKDYTGEFTVEGAAVDVEFAMTPKAMWKYTVNAIDANGELLKKLSDGEGYENDDVTYVYPGYYLQGTSLLSIAKKSSNPYYGVTTKLDSDGKVFEVKYDGTPVSDVVFYKEAEDMEGFTSRNSNNAPIRCSNGLGGTAEGDVLLTTLPAGQYKIHGQVWGTTGLNAGVKTKDGKELWTLASTGSLASGDSEEFMLTSETELYVYTENGDHNHMLDLIYIQKTGEYVAVSGISISKESIELVKGETTQLEATVAPDNATDKTVTWSSDNEKVATVDQTGKVTAVGGGEAVITAKAGDKTATCKVTVTVPVSGLAILDEDDNVLDSTHSLALHTGDEYTLTEVVSPEDATEQKVIWTSSNEAVAKIVDIVEEPHQVHIDAIAAGEATITASLAGHTTSFKVTVTDP
ncbi:MAG: Ig-like domain-containing protein, partial [Muribaculaceae bacterium]|nr:Ig-like domain-containing protein [Muribaculaceae bacterium]